MLIARRLLQRTRTQHDEQAAQLAARLHSLQPQHRHRIPRLQPPPHHSRACPLLISSAFRPAVECPLRLCQLRNPVHHPRLPRHQSNRARAHAGKRGARGSNSNSTSNNHSLSHSSLAQLHQLLRPLPHLLHRHPVSSSSPCNSKRIANNHRARAILIKWKAAAMWRWTTRHSELRLVDSV